MPLSFSSRRGGCTCRAPGAGRVIFGAHWLFEEESYSVIQQTGIEFGPQGERPCAAVTERSQRMLRREIYNGCLLCESRETHKHVLWAKCGPEVKLAVHMLTNKF
jgi:hypothetical protein